MTKAQENKVLSAKRLPELLNTAEQARERLYSKDDFGLLPSSSGITDSWRSDDRSDGVAIVSGGLDSVTMAYYLHRFGRKPHLVSFDYGQRHKKEIDYALWNAEQLGLRWSLIDLASVTDLIGNSALTSHKPPTHSVVGQRPIEVPEGHYAEDNMALTVVPNRNMMMLSVAIAIAVNAKYSYVAAGMHAGDHAQYPDCKPEFIDSMLVAARWGNKGFMVPDFEIMTPWIYRSKNDIATEALKSGVPLHMTWSCYKGGDVHCGRCGTCVERLEAIASVEDAPPHWDMTVYEDTEFWRRAVADYKAQK